MTGKHDESATVWIDPDDAPEWTDDQLDRAEHAVGGKVLRAASGTLTRPRGRPRAEAPKERLTIRLDAEIVEHFRSTGPGWQSRINEALRGAIRKTR